MYDFVSPEDERKERLVAEHGSRVCMSVSPVMEVQHNFPRSVFTSRQPGFCPCFQSSKYNCFHNCMMSLVF